MFKGLISTLILLLASVTLFTCNVSESAQESPKANKGSNPNDTLSAILPGSQPIGAKVNHAPTIGLGLKNVSMMEQESKTITLKARDVDGDAVQFTIQNLDSLRALFHDGTRAIEVLTGGDSLVLGFQPGLAKGNYRFRIAVSDPQGATEIQILTISVGKVNRPPTIAFAEPKTGTTFTIKEGQTLTLRVLATDSDGDGVKLLVLANPPWPQFGQGKYDVQTGVLTFSPSFQATESSETTFSDLVFRGKDDGSPSEVGQISARFIIQDSNSAPKWQVPTTTVSGKEGEPIVLDLSAFFLGDAEKDVVELGTSLGTIDKATRTWIYTPGFRDAGLKEAIITATDAHSPPASSTFKISITIAESIRLVDVAILTPVSGFIFRETVITVKWAIGDQLQTRDTIETLMVEGANVISRSFRDSLGNFGSDSITVIRDTRVPLSPRITVPARVNTARPQWNWQTGGEGNGRYRLMLDTPNTALALTEWGETSFTPQNSLAEGRHVLYVQEGDDAGNYSPLDSGVVTIDLTPPVVKILSPTQGSWTNAPVVDVKWTLDGIEQSVQVFETLVNDGVVQILREAYDGAGNRGADSVLILRRSMAGAAPSVGGNATMTNSPLWNWTSGKEGTGTFRLGWQAGNWFETTSAKLYNGQDLPEGIHTLYVSEIDSAGNWSAPGHFQIVVDRTAPLLTITGPDGEGAITSLDPTITGTIVEAQGGTGIRWSAPGMGGGSAIVTEGTWSISGMVYPEGNINVTVTSTDMAGNSSTPVSVTIYKRPGVLFVRKGISGSGTSWKDAVGELWQAMASRGNAKEIWVAEGEYSTSADGMGSLGIPTDVKVYGGFKPESLPKSVADRSLETLTTIIRNEGASPHFAVRMEGTKALLDGFVITATGNTNGLYAENDNTGRNLWILNATGLSPIVINPGNKGGEFILENCRVEGSTSPDKAAISIGQHAKVSIKNSIIQNNLAAGSSSGGGIWMGEQSELLARAVTLLGNTGVDSTGPRPLQLWVGKKAKADLEGTVAGGFGGIQVDSGANVTLNGERHHDD